MVKARDLRIKTREELEKMVGEERVKLRDLNFRLAGSQVKNVAEFKKVKKNIARILTVLGEVKL